MTKEEAQDILRVRVVLEGMAAGLAAESITAAEIVRLERCEIELERAVRKRRVPEAVEHNLKFHLGVCRASRSATLISVIEALYLRYAPRIYTVIPRLPGRSREQTQYVHTYHQATLDALRRADAKAAQRAMEADLTDALRRESMHEPDVPHEARKAARQPRRK